MTPVGSISKKVFSQGRLSSTIGLALIVVCSSSPDWSSPTSPAESAGRYTQAEIDYYIKVALGADFGGISAVVRKWADDVQIRLPGDVGQEDVAVLNAVTSELNRLGPP